MSKMQLTNKLRQPTVLKQIQSIDWNNTSNSPFVIELDPTTACDLACPGCISGELLNQEKFSNDRLIELTQEIIDSEVKAVILIGGGEPLSHPKIGEVITKLGQSGIQIGITTNGTFIDRYLDEIAEYANWVRVSVDAGKDDTFRTLRPNRSGKSKFNKIIQNMQLLAQRKKGILGYSFLIRTKADGLTATAAGPDEFGKVDTSNISELYEAAKLAKDIGCDYFEPKPSYDGNHYLVVHDAEEMEQVKVELEKAKRLETNDFKILESVNLEHSLSLQQQVIQPKSYNNCPVSQLRTLVTPSGVYVCPYFRGRQDMKIGDLNTESLQEMWQGNTRKSVMSYLDPSKHCGMHCIRHESNLQILDIVETNERNPTQIEKDDEDLFI